MWVLALAALGLLHTAWFISGVPLPLKAGVAGLLVVAAFRPGWALLIWAGLAPLTTSLAGLGGGPLLGSQLLQALTAAVVTGVVARYRTGSPTRLALPALVMATVAVASGLAELPARLLTTTRDFVTWDTIAGLLFQHAVALIQPLEPWYFALVVALGAALAWAAEHLVRRDAELAPRVVWCALMGHAGVGVLGISRIVGGSLRGGEFPGSLPVVFMTMRDHTQYDVNAAASILVMVILAAVGLASRRARLPLALAIGVATIGLWIAGSRVALAALLISVTGVFAIRARHSTRMLLIAVPAALATAGLIGWLAVGGHTSRNLNVPDSISSRLVMINAAVTMAREAPVLGIGAGTFSEASPEYGATRLMPILGRSHDNAHNYFLQTAAEQGALGLIALLLVLLAGLGPVMRTSPNRDPLTTWLAAGIVASILTWMTGHPLLETEAAMMFWLFFGVLAGMSQSGPANPAVRRIAGVFLVAIVVSVPFRAVEGERTANLDHLGIGVSLWQPAVDGERYREAGAEFSLFLPSGAVMLLPIRSATGTATNIELRIASRPIDAAVALPHMWRQFRIQVPESNSRYVKISFRVLNPPNCQGCLWVGKAIPLNAR